jgi:hypothetical protein
MRAETKVIIIILVLLGLFSVNSFAAIPPEQTNLNIYEVLAVAPHSDISEAQVEAVIPTDIPNGASSGTVSKMVLDRSLKSALKSDFIKSSPAGKTADTLKDGLNTEMALGGSPTDPTATQHKFKFKIDPIQAKGKIQYSGYLNASATYHGKDALYEITEDFHSYKLNLIHQINETEALSLVQLQWGW